MHKITKGLKKKKKTKKHKKEDELFDEAELEKYRREHQQEAAGPQEEQDTPQQGEQGAGSSDNEEWKRFKALTAGVDSVLKKTQGDLDRIKSTSYFQRKPPGTSAPEAKPVDSAPVPPAPTEVVEKKKAKRWVGFEEGSLGIDAPPPEEPEEEHVDTEESAPPATVDELLGVEPAAVTTEEEEEEEEDEEEPDDDIFDTSYVDVVKLAYIPDSPTHEEEDFDPFDTSIAEKVIREEEEQAKNKKKLVSLGCAVEVLTGRLDTTPALAGKKRRPVPRRPQDVDLLLDDTFSQEAEPSDEAPEASIFDEAPEPCKSLLDDDPDVSVPVVPLENLLVTSTNAAEEKNEEQGVDLRNLVAEFDLISDTVATPNTVVEVPISVPTVQEEYDELEDEFAALAAESVAKKPSEPQEEPEVGEKDPFDTTVASVILGEAPAQLDPFEVEPDYNPDTLSFPRQISGPPFPISPDVDIVLASEPQPTSEWAAFEDSGKTDSQPPPRPAPPRPAAPPLEITDNAILALAEDLEITQIDPFDTSFAENILPGKAELKLIESEILGSTDFDVNEARILSRSDSDFDFNPREDEEKVVSTVSIQITDPTGHDQQEEVEEAGLRSLTLQHRDLLGGSTTDLSKLGHDPIQPVEQEEEPQTEIDPFDTSVVDVIAAPGRAELKFLEKELLGETEGALKRSISDQDFNPRADEPQEVEPQQEQEVPDLLNVKAAVPKVVAFDVPTPSSRPDLLVVGSEEGARISKPLTPYYVDVKPAEIFAAQNGVVENEDPFDTSFAENLAPGKAELKIIESELVGESSGLKHSLSDQDFNPRSEEEQPKTVKTDTASNLGRRFSDFTGDRRRAPPCTLAIRGLTVTPVPVEVPSPASKPDLLVVEENAPVTAKPLTPAVESTLEYCDPFDTSIANNLLPGRAELKVLESELVTSLKRSYTDPDFNPREEDVEPEPQPETELKPAPEPVAERPDLLNLPSEAAPDTKTLTPLVEKSENPLGIDDDIDPFDTSIASDLVPSKAELRVLESELIGQ